MCAVSMVSDWGRRTWPNPNEITITKEVWEEYLRLKRNAQEIDRIIGQPDCVDPDKEKFEKQVEEVLRKNGVIK